MRRLASEPPVPPNSWTISPWTAPLALLLICVITYGVTLLSQGFYWDDWFLAYTIHHYGPSIFPEAFAVDRPLMGRIYLLTTSLLGDSLLKWQVACLITRWLSAVAFLFFLRSLWPDRALQNSAAALLFAVYPGFQQQYIAITHTNDFLVLSLYLLSLAALALSIRKRAWFWPLYLFSLVSGGFVVFTIEYYFGLELLRPVVLWLAFGDQAAPKVQAAPEIQAATEGQATSTGWARGKRGRFVKAALAWLPFAVLDGLFLAYRLATPTPRGSVTIFDRLQAGPVAAFATLGKTMLQDVWETGIQAWAIGVHSFTLLGEGALAALKFGGLLLACFGVAFFLLRSHAAQGSRFAPRRGFGVILLGLFALGVGGLPYWMADLSIRLAFPFDRFTLPLMLGAALLVVGLAEVLLPNLLAKAFVLSALVAIAVGFQYENGIFYARDWSLQKDFFWQLAWRIPGLEPGTILMTSDLPFFLDRDDSLSAPLNWIYAPGNSSRVLPYVFYDVATRVGGDVSKLTPGRSISGDYRMVSFEGSLDQSLLVYYQPPNCLKVYDPVRDQDPLEKPRGYSRLVQFSNPSLILTGANLAAVPPAYLSPEPAHGWCYFYQKAELARQVGDWAQVANLADQALKKAETLDRGKLPEIPPYIEGYAHLGEWEKAVHLTQLAWQKWSAMQPALCSTWQLIDQNTLQDGGKTGALDRIKQEIHCEF